MKEVEVEGRQLLLLLLLPTPTTIFSSFLSVNMTLSGGAAVEQRCSEATKPGRSTCRSAGVCRELTVPSSISLRQEPKSARRMWPFTSSRMLSGLMSLEEERRGRSDVLFLFSLFKEKNKNKERKQEVSTLVFCGGRSGWRVESGGGG